MVADRWDRINKMENVVYLLVISLGFIVNLISVLFLNKKYRVLRLENCIYSYIIFLIFFITFSKIIHLFIDDDIISLNNLFSNNIYLQLKFIFSGYSFIGGYIGTLISILLLSKIFKVNKIEIMILYIPSILLMYSILKIGCYIKGCCYSIISFFPIQLIESFFNFIAFLFVITLIKKDKDKNKVVGVSFILFGSIRFIISFFRVFAGIYTLIFIELFCIFLMYIGIKSIRKSIKKNIF